MSGTSSYDYNVRTGETSEHDGIEMSGSSQDGGGPIPPSISIPQPPILGPPLPQLPSPHVVGDPGPVVTLTHATAAAAENSAALALLGLGKTTTAAGPQMNKEEVCDTESGDAPPRTALSPAPRSSPRAADHVIRAPATAVAKVGDKHDRKSPDGGDRDNDSSRSSSRFSSDEDEAYQPVSSRLVRKRGRWEDEPRPTTRATRRVWTQTEPGSSDSAMGSGTVAGGEGGACQGRQVKRVRAGV